MANMQLPGNPRYQPKSLKEHFGYDNLARTLVDVELAVFKLLHARGIISKEEFALFTPEMAEHLRAITTSEMDEMERKVTKHDIRALVRLMQEHLPAPLRRYIHVPLTSYDVIDTARAFQFRHAHEEAVMPMLRRVIEEFRDHTLRYADQIQIGRTHGQHALPITIGFWFATVLSRLLTNVEEMDWHAKKLVGKISGPVGAHNAQVGLDFPPHFEQDVLKMLDLEPARISTQIVPPERMAYYLHACVMVQSVFGQFGRDCRHLMRTEIAELGEPFEEGQVGSSTMAHKRNPMTFENLEGTYQKSMAEFLKVQFTLVSEHQRDLVGSSLMRDFATIVVNLGSQLENLLREDRRGQTFLSRITVNAAACERNFAMMGDVILAEPLYLALQKSGYEGDAHELINHKAMPLVQQGKASSLMEAILSLRDRDEALEYAIRQIPSKLFSDLGDPKNYFGSAPEEARAIAALATKYLDSH